MKKFATALLTLVLALCCALGFAACEDENGKIENLDSVIQNEEAWDTAFENIDYTNFSMRVSMVDEDDTIINYCEISETAVYFDMGYEHEFLRYRTFYSIKNNDATYTTYRVDKVSKSAAELNDKTDKYFVGACTETVLKVSYADYFGLFTYDEEKGVYTYDGEIETTAYDFNEEELGTIYCFNNEVKVEKNKITSIKSDYRFENDNYNENTYYSFEYFNIGITEVKIPEWVINNAVKEN